LVLAEMDKSVEQLKAWELNLKNIMYHEKNAHKEAEAELKVRTLELINEIKLHIAGETDLLSCM
jgi:hypothetical protein